jgi:hypothetical protein
MAGNRSALIKPNLSSYGETLVFLSRDSMSCILGKTKKLTYFLHCTKVLEPGHGEVLQEGVGVRWVIETLETTETFSSVSLSTKSRRN